MSVRLLNDGPGAALFGKLPSHGDFLRWGEPVLAQQLDRWLTGAVERFAATHPDDWEIQLASMPTWCFAGVEDLSGAIGPSLDKVGRNFPIIACVRGRPLAESLARLLTESEHEDRTADALAAALSDLAAKTDFTAADGGEAGRWWRPGQPSQGFHSESFPIEAAFEQLFERGE